MSIVTGRNEVVAKVIFLHLLVILFTGGGSALVHAGIPPRSRPPLGANTPLGADTPPEADPPPGKQTPAYGLRAAGTHPTGMHSCILNCENSTKLILLSYCFIVGIVNMFRY